MAGKRVRTGCLGCRTRRRKCDEGKPQCQRCITGGFQCQYGTRLSFLPKNSWSLEEDTPSQSRRPYRTLQFVTPNPKGARSSPTARQDQIERDPTPNSDEAGRASLAIDDEDNSFTLHPQLSASDELQVPIAPDANASSNADDETPSGRFHDALNGLLSLRAEDTLVSGSLPSEHSLEVFTTPGNGQLLDDLILSSGLSPSNLIPHGISEEKVLVLLKYWRYEVATWLDICDLGHGFGLFISRLATYSLSVLQAVLALTAACLDHVSETTQPLFSTGRSRVGENSEEQVSGLESIGVLPEIEFICAVLDNARSLCLNRTNDFFPKVGIPQPITSIGILGGHLQLRLDLSRALVEERPLVEIPALLHKGYPTAWHKSQLARDCFLCAGVPLLLCAQAVQFCYGREMYDSASPGTRVTEWVGLTEELDAWYSRRPSEFRSVLEIEASDDEFPALLFSHGASTFANQLYHTAMLLLLLHKPRTAQITKSYRASSTSFLWHIRRICGIALNNELRSSWDLSLLASFVIAAKKLTHEAQHQTILGGLGRVAEITGLDTSYWKTILQDEWGDVSG